MDGKELEYFLKDYEPQDLGDLSQLLPDNEDDIEEIFNQARQNENVLTNSDHKRINALKDYLKFETIDLFARLSTYDFR